MLQVFEKYDIVNDRQSVRINIFPFCSVSRYSLFLHDQMTVEQISESFKKLAGLMDADARTKETD